jgi:protoporphyrinogen oxidase
VGRGGTRTTGAGTAVLGAGPAGLTGAYVLARHDTPVTVFEADGVVGGLAKTIEFGGYRFDLGGHRFFTKLAPIQSLWEELLGEDLLVRPRLSRIYYDGKYFAYPLRAQDVVARLGVREASLCAGSYLWNRVLARPEPHSFEDWVTARFGRRLYDAFFRSYTEKVWGVDGSEIRAEWAAQRIKNFSLGKAVASMLGISRTHVTTLIEEFHYPRLGPGQMWETLADRLERSGVAIELNRRCTSVAHDGDHVEGITVRQNGTADERAVDGVLSSIPINDLVHALDPAAPAEVLAAADRLRYRALCIVALVIDQDDPFPDNWIYLHDPDTRAGRVQNFGAWSESMVVPGTTCLGVEYFCFEGDDIWELDDREAVALATTELDRIGLIDAARVRDGVKIRVPNAYPMYDSYYREALGIIRPFLAQFENLATCGRNGLHRYNNQDHSMWTGVLAALNLVGDGSHDVWAVNTEAEYLEEGALADELLELELAPAPNLATTFG